MLLQQISLMLLRASCRDGSFAGHAAALVMAIVHLLSISEMGLITLLSQATKAENCLKRATSASLQNLATSCQQHIVQLLSAPQAIYSSRCVGNASEIDWTQMCQTVPDYRYRSSSRRQ